MDSKTKIAAWIFLVFAVATLIFIGTQPPRIVKEIDISQFGGLIVFEDNLEFNEAAIYETPLKVGGGCGSIIEYISPSFYKSFYSNDPKAIMSYGRNSIKIFVKDKTSGFWNVSQYKVSDHLGGYCLKKKNSKILIEEIGPL